MRYKKNNQCIYEHVEDGIILFNESNNDTIILNQTASFLYDHCHVGTIETIIQMFLSALENVENQEVIERECRECIEKMVESGIILEVKDD